MTEKQAVRLAAVGDLHVKKTSQGALAPLLAPVNERRTCCCCVAISPTTACRKRPRILAKELTAVVRIPIVAVLGNHDYESGQQREVCAILAEAGVKVLDGEAIEIAGIGFAGAKGFPRRLRPRHARRLGRAGRQALRAGSDR